MDASWFKYNQVHEHPHTLMVVRVGETFIYIQICLVWTRLLRELEIPLLTDFIITLIPVFQVGQRKTLSKPKEFIMTYSNFRSRLKPFICH